MTLFETVVDMLKHDQTTCRGVDFSVDVQAERIVVTENLSYGGTSNHVLIRQPDGTLQDKNGFHIRSPEDYSDWFVYTFYMR